MSQWREAMTSEFNALMQKWHMGFTPSPPHRQAIGCKWIFKIKRHADGSIKRSKAHLVIKKYNQQDGVDYTDTFSPVVKLTTIWKILSFAVSKRWPIRQLDVSNAFLHGHLNEEVYIVQPPCFIDERYPHHVCRLKKISLWPQASTACLVSST